MPLLIAHAGHWIGQVLFVAPLLIFVVVLVRAKLEERREQRAAEERLASEGA